MGYRGIACQVCHVKFHSVTEFKKHMHTKVHQQQMTEVFQKDVFKDPGYFPLIVVLEQFSKCDLQHPIIGLSLLTLCFSPEVPNMFYLCHVCEEKCSQEQILCHLFSADHYSNYYIYTDPNVLRFSWLPSMDMRHILRPEALKDTQDRGAEQLQMLDLPEKLFAAVEASSYSEAMHTLNENEKLFKLLRAGKAERRMIQTYQRDPNRKHPLLGLQHLVECVCAEQTEKRYYLCTLCHLTLASHKIIKHVLSFDHIFCYFNAWHPSTLLSKECYTNYTSFFIFMMLDFAKQTEEIHGVFTDIKQVTLDPALFTSVDISCYAEALNKLESIRKERNESSLITSIKPGKTLVSHAVITSCRLRCQGCNLIFGTVSQYVMHVQQDEHKQMSMKIFGQDAVGDRKGRIPHLGLCRYLKGSSVRTEPVIGVPLIVMCLCTQADVTPIYVCFACEDSFPESCIRGHLNSPKHLIHTLMHQNPWLLPFAWEKLDVQVLQSLAWEEERARGQNDMMLKILDVPYHILQRLNPPYYPDVLEELAAFRHHLKREVPKCDTIGKPGKSQRFPVLGQQFLVAHSIANKRHQPTDWGFLCLLCKRRLSEDDSRAHVFSREHVEMFLERAHPGSLNSSTKNTETLLDLAKQAADIHPVVPIETIKLPKPIWEPCSYETAIAILTSAYRKQRRGELIPTLALRKKLVPTETLKEVDKYHVRDANQENSGLTKKTEKEKETGNESADKSETSSQPVPVEKEAESEEHSQKKTSDRVSDRVTNRPGKERTRKECPEITRKLCVEGGTDAGKGADKETLEQSENKSETRREAISETSPEQIKSPGCEKYQVIGGEKREVAVKLTVREPSFETPERRQQTETDDGSESGIERTKSSQDALMNNYICKEIERKQQSSMSDRAPEKRRRSENACREIGDKRRRLCSEGEKTSSTISPKMPEEGRVEIDLKKIMNMGDSGESSDQSAVDKATVPYNCPQGDKLWSYLKMKGREPVIGLNALFECHCDQYDPLYLCECCCLMILEKNIVSHVTGFAHRITHLMVVDLDPELYNDIAKQNFECAIKKVKELHAQQDISHSLPPTSVLAGVQPWDTSAISNAQHEVTSVTQDTQVSQVRTLVHQTAPLTSNHQCQGTSSTFDLQPQVNPTIAELQPQVVLSTSNCPPQATRGSEDKDPAETSTDLLAYLKSSTRTQPIIGLKMLTRFRSADRQKSCFFCKCCSVKMPISSRGGHLISSQHHYNYIKLMYPEQACNWVKDPELTAKEGPLHEELRERAAQLEKLEGCKTLKMVETELGDSRNSEAPPSSATAAMSVVAATTSKTDGTSRRAAATSNTGAALVCAATCKTAAASKSKMTSKTSETASKTTVTSKDLVTTVATAETRKPSTICENADGTAKTLHIKNNGGSYADGVHNSATPMPGSSVCKTPPTETSDSSRSKMQSSKSQLRVGGNLMVAVVSEGKQQVYCQLCSVKVTESGSDHMMRVDHQYNYVRYKLPGWTATRSEMDKKLLNMMVTYFAKADRDAGLKIQRVEVTWDQYNKLSNLPDKEAPGGLKTIMRQQRELRDSSSSTTSPVPEDPRQQVPSTGPHEALHLDDGVYRPKREVAGLSSNCEPKRENTHKPKKQLVQIPEMEPTSREDGKVTLSRTKSALSLTSVGAGGVELTPDQLQSSQSSDGNDPQPIRAPSIQNSDITVTVKQEVVEPEVEARIQVKVTPAPGYPGEEPHASPDPLASDSEALVPTPDTLEGPERRSPLVSLDKDPPSPVASIKTEPHSPAGPSQTGEDALKHNVSQELPAISTVTGERTVGCSRLSIYLTVKRWDTEPIIGQGFVFECQTITLSPFFLCGSCSKTLFHKHICEHMVSTEHRVCYIQKQFPHYLHLFSWWEGDMSQERKLQLLKEIAMKLSDQEKYNKMDAQVTLLDKRWYELVKTAPYCEAVNMLQFIRRKKNLSPLRLPNTASQQMGQQPQGRQSPEEPLPTEPQSARAPETDKSGFNVAVNKGSFEDDVNSDDKKREPAPPQREVGQEAKHNLEKIPLIGDMQGVKRRRIMGPPDGSSRDEGPPAKPNPALESTESLARPHTHKPQLEDPLPAEPTHSSPQPSSQPTSGREPAFLSSESTPITPAVTPSLPPPKDKGPSSDRPTPSIVDRNMFENIIALVRQMKSQTNVPPSQASPENHETTTSSTRKASKSCAQDKEIWDSRCELIQSMIHSASVPILPPPANPLKRKCSPTGPVDNVFNYENRQFIPNPNSGLSTANWSLEGYSDTGICQLKPSLIPSIATNPNPSQSQQPMGYNATDPSLPIVSRQFTINPIRTANPDPANQQFMDSYKGLDYTGRNRVSQVDHSCPTAAAAGPSDPLSPSSYNTAGYYLPWVRNGHSGYSSSEAMVGYTVPDNHPAYLGNLCQFDPRGIYPSQICPQQGAGQVPALSAEGSSTAPEPPGWVCLQRPPLQQEYRSLTSAAPAAGVGEGSSDTTYTGFGPLSTSANDIHSQRLMQANRYSNNIFIQLQNPPVTRCAPTAKDNVISHATANNFPSTSTIAAAPAEVDACRFFC
ncbi:uncharacterized protein [Centroberyx affinis]|uniref:uncharacterized protein n=1 Tax=Centroberyx affinis TaxID=166261 RepID=UPI003A5BC47F